MHRTTRFKRGDVVLVSFPFTNLETTKKRPSVVISSHVYNDKRPDVVLMAVSSRVREPFEFGEAIISDWKHAGLIKQSVFKPLIATVEQSKILRKLGELTTADLENLKAVIDIILYT